MLHLLIQFAHAIALLQIFQELVERRLIHHCQLLCAAQHLVLRHRDFFLLRNFADEERQLHAILRVRGGVRVNLILLRLDQLARDAALRVLAHEVIDHIARLIRHGSFRQVKIYLAQQRRNDLVAHGLALGKF